MLSLRSIQHPWSTPPLDIIALIRSEVQYGMNKFSEVLGVEDMGLPGWVPEMIAIIYNSDTGIQEQHPMASWEHLGVGNWNVEDGFDYIVTFGAQEVSGYQHNRFMANIPSKETGHLRSYTIWFNYDGQQFNSTSLEHIWSEAAHAYSRMIHDATDWMNE